MPGNTKSGKDHAMQRPHWFRRLVALIAPEACPLCDGGSGAIYDESTGSIRACDACLGTGLAHTDSDELQRLIDARFRERGKHQPRSAA